jgi:hypothetical protein
MSFVLPSLSFQLSPTEQHTLQSQFHHRFDLESSSFQQMALFRRHLAL